ncbi:DUF742 domain-containing protein [Streptomyces sp. NPDC020883]|uniref:DUF742 domain-containing protein n=1 Tax=Streptomyces sp. NPDC020883 TaxID=3365099 RepID=UPI003791A018
MRCRAGSRASMPNWPLLSALPRTQGSDMASRTVFREAARRLRPYALTGGRTQPSHPLGMETMLVAHPDPACVDLGLDGPRILALCNGPIALAELAGRLGEPLVVVRVLAADLIDRRALTLAEHPRSLGPDRSTLEAVLAGLQRL